MCEMIEEMCKKVREEALALGRAEAEIEGARKSKITNAKEMLKDGSLSIEQIARFSGLSINEVRELEKTLKN